MPKPKSVRPRPTQAELAILRVLWQKGASTVRDVHAIVNRVRPTGYTTVLKLMQIMTDKGLVRRDESERTHVYEAAHGQALVQRQLLADLVERAFEGSAASLVMQALSTRRTSAEEIAQIRQMLDELEGGSR